MSTMLLTPENIQNQQFHVRFRGFDVDEVDAFLEKVAENYLVLVKENEKLKDSMSAIQGERDQIQSQERSFKNAIVAAQNIADEMQAKAQQEAHVLKENARLEAAAMIDEAKEQETALKDQISSLLLEKQKLKEDLHSFLVSHMDRLDNQYPVIGQDADGVKKEPAVKAALRPSIIGDISGNHKEVAPSQADLLPEDSEPLFREAPEEVEDLADLYEKIDLSELGDDGLLEQAPGAAPPAGHKKSATQFATDALADMELTMPDLDGDMLFTLDDPLDDPLAPDIDIDMTDEQKDHCQK